MHALFRTFFPVLALQKLLKWLRFDRVAVKYTLLCFMNHRKNVGFNFSRYGAHINQVMW